MSFWRDVRTQLPVVPSWGYKDTSLRWSEASGLAPATHTRDVLLRFERLINRRFRDLSLIVQIARRCTSMLTVVMLRNSEYQDRAEVIREDDRRDDVTDTIRKSDPSSDTRMKLAPLPN